MDLDQSLVKRLHLLTKNMLLFSLEWARCKRAVAGGSVESLVSVKVSIGPGDL